MSDLLGTIGRWTATEAGFEGAVALLVAGGSWTWAMRVLGSPADGRPFTELEVAVVVGAVAALMGWALARNTHLMGRTGRVAMTLPALGGALGAAWGLSTAGPGRFENTCTGDLGGEIVQVRSPVDPAAAVGACGMHAVPGNAYLPGTYVYPTWSGDVPGSMWLWFAAVGLLGGLGFRDLRLRPTRVARRIWDQLELAPAQGPASSIQGTAADGRVIACTNATLWGEPCGQLYSAAYEMQPGEWCVRCKQAFTRCERELTFSVVTLFTADIDVLNGLERLDTVAWDRGDPMPPDARVSGQERWVDLGSVSLPDVLTVAQALALVIDRLSVLTEGRDERAREAARLARERASRVAAWIWFGNQAHRMTYARPTSRVRFAVGSRRLSDLAAGAGEDLALQLDIGLLPVELRQGYHRTFLDARRADVRQNSKTDYWVPVAPAEARGAPGAWVPRVEGAALQSWLSLDRRAGESGRGAGGVLPYLPYDPERRVERDGEGRVLIDGKVEPLPTGPLDLARVEMRPDQREVELRRTPGDSIGEWDWLEWPQLELLRRHPLVLVQAEETT